MIPRWKWTRKYCSSKIPVIKGVFKTLFFTESKVIMLFLPRGICSKRPNTLYMVWIYTREKLTIINTGLFRAQHLNYGSNVSQYWIKVRDISVNSNGFSCNFATSFANFFRRYSLSWKFGKAFPKYQLLREFIKLSFSLIHYVIPPQGNL